MQICDIEVRVNKVISEASDAKEISGGLRFSEDLGLDSLGVVDLITAIEEEFSVMLPDGDIENVQSVNDLYNILRDELSDCA